MTPAPKDLPGGFRQVDQKTIVTSRVFSVEHRWLEDPGGRPFERDVVVHLGAVAVVAVHADGTASLVRQLRVAQGEEVLEIPAGTRDVAGEDPALTARRELAEEAGLEASELRQLAVLFNSPGYSSQRTVIYLATGLSVCATARAGPEEEHMTVERVPLADVERLVAQGRLLDSTSISGLLLARAALADGSTDGGGHA